MMSFTILNKCKAGALTKIALLERSLRQKPTALQCPCPENGLTKVTREEYFDLEDVLFFFHTKCVAAVAAAPPRRDVCSSQMWILQPQMLS